ncbi:MAG TPA: adenylyltransferase/cytidyltransferase family protein [Patescibacteria group bacterium]|nr:adenylyltransferase/cytidyltransferase family protein [Patescibacteria group bacterium]
MKKVASLKRIAELSKKTKSNKKTVGLILGSFDILHMGHIHLFQFAKKNVDLLIVGLDNDQTIKNTKGEPRPINSYKRRSNFLSELSSVDYIFQITKVFKHGDNTSFTFLENMVRKINPTHILTSINCDGLWKEKRNFAKKLGIKFIPDKSKTVTHSSEILKKIEANL